MKLPADRLCTLCGVDKDESLGRRLHVPALGVERIFHEKCWRDVESFGADAVLAEILAAEDPQWARGAPSAGWSLELLMGAPGDPEPLPHADNGFTEGRALAEIRAGVVATLTRIAAGMGIEAAAAYDRAKIVLAELCDARMVERSVRTPIRFRAIASPPRWVPGDPIDTDDFSLTIQSVGEDADNPALYRYRVIDAGGQELEAYEAELVALVEGH